MIKYGLISETDARTLEKTIDLICKEFPNDNVIDMAEIGLFDCGTSSGLMDYVSSKGRLPMLTGFDNEKDKPIVLPEITTPGQRMIFIKGNSNETYNQIADNSQHLIFEDSCHCFACVCSTFFCYAPKVKVGGYLAFHDTGKHILPFKDFQHGDEKNPLAYISVRKALDNLELLQEDKPDDNDYRRGWRPETDEKVYKSNFGFRLVFDEADETNPAGGICVFKKLY